MNKTTKPTATELFNAAIDHTASLGSQLNAHRQFERTHAHNAWLAQGGCQRCHGRGRVVTWDTLDCMDGSCAAFGACPEGEKCTAKTVGPDPGYSSRYDRWMGVADPFKPSPSLLALEAAYESARLSERAAQAAARPARGKPVRVVRGRKVPIGLEGEITWVGAGFRGGERVGIRDIQGNVHWTDAKNIVVL